MKYPLYNNTLCPDLWDKKGDEWTMKPEILKTLRQIVKDFDDEQLKENGVEVAFDDVVIVGSSTNYNWSSYSDIDLHIMVDYTKMDMSKEEAEAMLSAIKGNWNKSHDISIKGHELEINFGDVAAKSAITSIYSIQNGKWVMKPVKEKPTFNKELIKKKHAELKAKFEEILRTDDEAALKKMLEKIYIFRQAGLDKGGELSEENIVFKILRAQGYLDKLKAHINTIYDRDMTVKESLFDNPEDRYKPEDKAGYVAAVNNAKARAEKLGKPFNDVVDGEDNDDLDEASYPGNLGVMEIVKFYELAKPRDISKFERLASEKTPDGTMEAWLLVQAVTGMKLRGKEEFGDEAKVTQYKNDNSI